MHFYKSIKAITPKYILAVSFFLFSLAAITQTVFQVKYEWVRVNTNFLDTMNWREVGTNRHGVPMCHNNVAITAGWLDCNFSIVSSLNQGCSSCANDYGGGGCPGVLHIGNVIIDKGAVINGSLEVRVLQRMFMAPLMMI